MSAQNKTLVALDKNARFKETTNYSVLAELIDARAKFGTAATPTQSEYKALLENVVKTFPDQNYNSADVIANAWMQLVDIFMKNFFHNMMSEKGTSKYKEFRKVLSASNIVEKGFKIIELPEEHFLVPSQSAQCDIPLNNVEMSLAFNYGALEQIINSIYYFNEVDKSAVSFCGLSRDNHSTVIDLIGEFAQHQYDFTYDLLWGASDEQYQDEELPPHPATVQRNAILNSSNLYSLLN